MGSIGIRGRITDEAKSKGNSKSFDAEFAEGAKFRKEGVEGDDKLVP